RDAGVALLDGDTRRHRRGRWAGAGRARALGRVRDDRAAAPRLAPGAPGTHLLPQHLGGLDPGRRSAARRAARALPELLRPAFIADAARKLGDRADRRLRAG